MLITSFQNPKIKEIKELRDRRARDESSLFLIEGYRELLKASSSNFKIKTLFYCEELFLKDNEQRLIGQIRAEKIRVSKAIFEKISYRDRPDGLLAIAFQNHLGLSDLKEIVTKTENPFFVVAERIEKPGNLGTILRSSDGVKVDAAIVSDPLTDIFNPNVVRSSIGALFTQPVIQSSALELIDFFKKNKIKIIAATPHSDLVYYEVDMRGALAIIVGTEQYGLSDLWMKNADYQVKIPMRGIADSLNVGAATTILLYEVLRQRKIT